MKYPLDRSENPSLASNAGVDRRRRLLSALRLAIVAIAAASGAGVLAPSASADAGFSSIERGRTRSAQCVACHGPSGITENPTFPHLAGQHAAYLKAQLERFRSGARDHPLMTPIAMSLSDEEIHDLAMYFASISLQKSN